MRHAGHQSELPFPGLTAGLAGAAPSPFGQESRRLGVVTAELGALAHLLGLPVGARIVDASVDLRRRLFDVVVEHEGLPPVGCSLAIGRVEPAWVCRGGWRVFTGWALPPASPQAAACPDPDEPDPRD